MSRESKNKLVYVLCVIAVGLVGMFCVLVALESREEQVYSLLAFNNEQRAQYDQYIAELKEEYESSYSDAEVKYGESLVENYALSLQLEESTKIDQSEFSKEEVYLLAKCVQAEAGHYENASEAQKLVTKVILNRLSSPQFANTISDVIFEKVNGAIQFDVAYDGALENQEVTTETLNNVYEVLLFDYDVPSDVLFFYSSSLKENNWVKKLKVYKEVEGTVFCYNEER